jgi:hypothetical protein
MISYFLVIIMSIVADGHIKNVEKKIRMIKHGELSND